MGKGIVLFSAGLDSLLTAKILMAQGIEVIGLHSVLPFVPDDFPLEELKASKLAKENGFKLEYYRCGSEFLEIIKNPDHGYGKNMNPCVDCKIHFIKKAAELMNKIGADFVATGEVVGQRPMSQLKHVMNRIEKITNLEGRLLRPLSAKLLKPTLVEKNGIVDREKLYDINGRSRKRQMKLAREFGIDNYSTPAGGCQFTDSFIANRIRDLLKHHENHEKTDFFLTTVGRHFRINDSTKIIVSKNENENHELKKYINKANYFLIPLFKGPSVFVKGELDNKEIDLVASILARYGKPATDNCTISIYKNDNEMKKIEAKDIIDNKTLETMRI